MSINQALSSATTRTPLTSLVSLENSNIQILYKFLFMKVYTDIISLNHLQLGMGRGSFPKFPIGNFPEISERKFRYLSGIIPFFY